MSKETRDAITSAACAKAANALQELANLLQTQYCPIDHTCDCCNNWSESILDTKAMTLQPCRLCKYSYPEDCGLSELGGLPHAPRMRCQGLVDPVTGHLRYYDCDEVRTDPTRGCVGFKLHEEDEL